MTETEVRVVLADNLRRLRKQRGLSQLRLATELQMAMTFISDIENGKKWVSPETLAKFATFFRVPLAQLFAQPQDAEQPEHAAPQQSILPDVFAATLQAEINRTVAEVCRRFGMGNGDAQ